MGKHLRGESNREESNLIDRFTSHFINRNKEEVFISDEHKKRIGSELYRRIHVKPIQSKWTWLRATAAVFAFIFLGLGFWQLDRLLFQSSLQTLQTAPGERVKHTLEDGTIVHLNGNTTLSYPEKFAKTNRRVSVQGEAFFEVQPDSFRPFKIESGGVETTVLGTKFNISSYSGDSLLAVSLVEGAVRVEAENVVQKIVPGQQFRYNPYNHYSEVKPFNAYKILAWRSNQILLEQTSFRELTSILYRQYGVEVQLMEEEIAVYTLSGNFENASIETVLTAVCTAKGLKYELKLNKAIIYKPKQDKKSK